MIHPSDISAVVLSYARPWNIPIIVQSLVDYGFEDIHVVDNWQDDSLISCVFDSELKSKVHLVQAKQNARTASRHIPKFKYDVIATVDDDYVVTEEGWDRLIGAWTGGDIVAQVPAGQFLQAYKVPFINIGYGSLFSREWVVPIVEVLLGSHYITMDDWFWSADRVFTTFVSSWTALRADDETLVRMSNPAGELSETDKSSIHLKDGYWIAQWELVAKVMRARADIRDMFLRRDRSLSEYRTQMGYLSHAGYGAYRPENG